jgi:hypothetical protein
LSDVFHKPAPVKREQAAQTPSEKSREFFEGYLNLILSLQDGEEK